jgi:hypothetical protein
MVDQIMSKYIKFVGEFSKLKHMGFTFCNYSGMRWKNQSVVVFKKFPRVTFGSLTGYEGEAYESLIPLLEKPSFNIKELSPHGCVCFYINDDGLTTTIDSTQYNKESFDIDRMLDKARADVLSDTDIPLRKWHEILVPESHIAPLIELHRNGWLQVCEHIEV